jgi:hypothetical protein
VEIKPVKGIFENQTIANDTIQSYHFFHTCNRLAVVPWISVVIYEQDPAKQPYYLLGIIVSLLLAVLSHLYLYLLPQLPVPGSATGFKKKVYSLWAYHYITFRDCLFSAAV